MQKRLLLLLGFVILFAFSALFTVADDRERQSEAVPASSTLPIAGTASEHSIITSKHVNTESSYQTSCQDIDPQVGNIVQHDQIGSTWYDFQKNGSVGRMIAVGPGGHRHTIFHETQGVYPDYPRYVTYNCKDSLDNWLGSTWIDGGSGINAGFANIGVMHDGCAVVIYHTTTEDPDAASVLKFQDTGWICSDSFTNRYDLPDWLQGDEPGLWPKMGIVYDTEVDTDYIHIVMTEGKTTGGNQRLGYLRCHLIDSDTLFCETPTGQSGVVSPTKVLPNIEGCGQSCPIGYFGECEAPGVPSGEYPNTISAVFATSPVSNKVAIVFTNKRESGTSQVNNDVFYFESTDNGDGWFTQYGGTWPPTVVNGMLNNITDYPTGATERAYCDVAACYDYNDSLHIVWSAVWFDSSNNQTSNDANLYHWSKDAGISLIASGYWSNTNPGAWNRNISKMSISAMDPVHHQGGEPDSVFLYCIWIQFNSGDLSANVFTNGEIYGSASADGGNTWGIAFNLTKTQTPDCASGECLSENWASLAQNLTDGNLHIQYICDRDAGGAVMDSPSVWTENPVMYLELEAWNPADTPLIANFSADPESGCVPLEVNFADLSLGNPISWFWEFGDESTSNEQNPEHIYNSAGMFNVKLKVSNESETDSIIKYNYVLVFPIVADFHASPQSGLAPLTVQFYDDSDCNPTSWFWDFGDDSTSTEQNPEHTYEETGYYDVKLHVSNGADIDSIIKSDYIYVYCMGHIAGYVKDTLEQPIYDAKVKIHETSESTWTDILGYYEFINKIPGEYTLTAEAPNYATMEASNIMVVCPETTWVNFTLWPEFFSVFDYPVFNEIAFVLLTGDFNGDNNVDIITRGWVGSQSKISRLWGHGDGTFTPQTPIVLGESGDYVWPLVEGYFNSDDFLDLAVGLYDSLAIFLNDGSGDFLPPKYFSLQGGTPFCVSKCYLNSDAYLDIVVANFGEENLSILSGDGNGDFTFVKNIDLFAYSVDAGDFNRDGNTDLVVGDQDSLTVLLGDGNWNFTRSYATYFGGIHSVSTMNSLADFNCDGNLDMIFCIPYYPVPGPSRIGILFGDGAGGFSSVNIIHSPYASTFGAAPGDFDGDKNLDFAVTYHDAVKLYFGDGAGNFPQSVLTSIGQVSTSASVSIIQADFNKDGNADVAVGRVDPLVSILLNLDPPRPTIEDEFVITGYTSVNLNVTDMYGSSANIQSNTIAGADYYQRDCNLDGNLDDRVFNFNPFPGRYVVGVTARPDAPPGNQYCLGIRVNGSFEVTIYPAAAQMHKGFSLNDTAYFIVTDSFPTLCIPPDDSCFGDFIDTMTFFWNEIEGVTKYHFQLDQHSDFPSPIIDDSAVADTSHKVAASFDFGRFYWRVRANGGVWSVYSNPYSFAFATSTCGDVNLDCEINLSDPICLANYYFGKPCSINPWASDVNCDTSKNLGDALIIAYYYFGKPGFDLNCCP